MNAQEQMTHPDKIGELVIRVLDAQLTIKLTKAALLHVDGDTAKQAFGALSLAANTLETAMCELEQLAMDIGKGGVA